MFAALVVASCGALIDPAARLHGPTLERDRPRVMFVIDRSASMGGAVTQGPGTFWSVLSSGVERTAATIDADADLGAMFFPDTAAGAACGVDTSLSLAPSRGNAGALASLMHTSAPSGGTPLPAALAVVRANTEPSSVDSPLFVVVTTDGYPNCNADITSEQCLCPDGTSCPWGEGLGCLDRDSAITQLQALRDHVAGTYVLAIAAGDSPEVTAALPGLLDAYATAGNVDGSGAGHFVDGSDPTAVSDAIAHIVVPLARCRLHLAAGTDPPKTDAVLTLGTDTWSSTTDPNGDGWRYTDDAHRHVEALGSACDALVASETLPSLVPRATPSNSQQIPGGT